MTTENTDTPLMADCPSATCSPVISAPWHAEYLKASDRAIRMEMQRDEARREAERWRDCFKTGMSMQPKAPSNVFPWENSQAQPPQVG
jgi:hypothetical protein